MMYFEELKKDIKKIYDKKSYPVKENVGYDNRIYSYGKQNLGGRPENFAIIGWKQLRDDLFEKKGFSSMKDFHDAYWDFSAELFNRNNGNVGSIMKLLEDRVDELRRAYYMVTEPLYYLFTDEDKGKELYKKQNKLYVDLINNLCYLNIYAFEVQMQSHDFLYNKLIDENVVDYLEQKYSLEIKEKYYSENKLLGCIEKAKEIKLQRVDVRRKVGFMKAVLNLGLFNLERRKSGKVSMWRDLDDKIKVEVTSFNEAKATNNNLPTKDEIEKIIQQAAENITNKNNSNHYSVKTKVKFLRQKVDNPKGRPKIWIKNIIDNVSEKDRDRLNNRIEKGMYRPQNNWIESLYETLESKGFGKYADILGRE